MFQHLSIHRLKQLWTGQLPLSVTFWGYWLGGGILIWVLGTILIGLTLLPMWHKFFLEDFIGCFTLIGIFAFFPITALYSALLLMPVHRSAKNQNSRFRYLAEGVVLLILLFDAILLYLIILIIYHAFTCTGPSCWP